MLWILVVLVGVLQGNRANSVCVHIHMYEIFIYLHIDVYIKKFIIRNWLIGLWRLSSPKICGWRPRRPNGIVPVQFEG